MARKDAKLRECPKCHKRLAHKYFNHVKAAGDGLSEYCIACNREVKAERKERKTRERIKSDLNECDTMKFVLPPPKPKPHKKGAPLLNYRKADPPDWSAGFIMRWEDR